MNQMSFSDMNPDSTMSASEMRERAGMWTFRNYTAWQRMKEIAREKAKEGKHFSIADLAESARYRMHLNGDDQGFKLNNSLRAALARRLIYECPECRPYIETRASKVDWL